MAKTHSLNLKNHLTEITIEYVDKNEIFKLQNESKKIEKDNVVFRRPRFLSEDDSYAKKNIPAFEILNFEDASINDNYFSKNPQNTSSTNKNIFKNNLSQVNLSGAKQFNLSGIENHDKRFIAMTEASKIDEVIIENEYHSSISSDNKILVSKKVLKKTNYQTIAAKKLKRNNKNLKNLKNFKTSDTSSSIHTSQESFELDINDNGQNNDSNNLNFDDFNNDNKEAEISEELNYNINDIKYKFELIKKIFTEIGHISINYANFINKVNTSKYI